MSYCLDTNVIIRVLRDKNAAGIVAQLTKLAPQDIFIPDMVRAELLTGAAKSARPDHHRKLVEQFLTPFPRLAFADDAPDHYADIRVTLEASGDIIGPNDLVIAATTRAAQARLVTANLKEFRRVPGLAVEDW